MARSQGLSWKSRNAASEWPTAWERPSEKWPSPPSQWVPDHSGQAAVMCVGRSQIVSYPSLAAAIAADTEHGLPCAPGCNSMHYICWVTPGRVHVVGGVNEPPPLSRAAAWQQAYPSRYIEQRRADMQRNAQPKRPKKRKGGDDQVTDWMPNDPDELDFAIGFDMLDKALRGVAEAEQYAADRAKHEAEHGTPDPESFPKWSEISEPGTLEYGPYQQPPNTEPE
jgi:hypothetical protein